MKVPAFDIQCLTKAVAYDSALEQAATLHNLSGDQICTLIALAYLHQYEGGSVTLENLNATYAYQEASMVKTTTVVSQLAEAGLITLSGQNLRLSDEGVRVLVSLHNLHVESAANKFDKLHFV